MEERKFTITLSLTDREFGELRNSVYNQANYYEKSAGSTNNARLQIISEHLAICKFLYQELSDVRMKGVLHELD